MNADHRIVTKMPLDELWDASEALAHERVRNLDRSSLTELLWVGPVKFVVADCGIKLRWIPTHQRFDF